MSHLLVSVYSLYLHGDGVHVGGRALSPSVSVSLPGLHVSVSVHVLLTGAHTPLPPHTPTPHTHTPVLVVGGVLPGVLAVIVRVPEPEERVASHVLRTGVACVGRSGRANPCTGRERAAAAPRCHPPPAQQACGPHPLSHLPLPSPLAAAFADAQGGHIRGGGRGRTDPPAGCLRWSCRPARRHRCPTQR